MIEDDYIQRSYNTYNNAIKTRMAAVETHGTITAEEEMLGSTSTEEVEMR